MQQYPPRDRDSRKLSHWCRSPWCANLVLIAINMLVIVSTSTFLIGRAGITKECSKQLYWVAVTFELYLCVIIIRYFLFAMLHHCGFCDSSRKKHGYRPDHLKDFRRRFFIHVLFSFLDLVALSPISIWAGRVVSAVETKMCNQYQDIRTWNHISQVLLYYSYVILFLSSIFFMVGLGICFFWRATDSNDQSPLDYFRSETEDSID